MNELRENALTMRIIVMSEYMNSIDAIVGKNHEGDCESSDLLDAEITCAAAVSSPLSALLPRRLRDPMGFESGIGTAPSTTPVAADSSVVASVFPAIASWFALS
jgi:hypothetical protein